MLNSLFSSLSLHNFLQFQRTSRLCLNLPPRLQDKARIPKTFVMDKKDYFLLNPIKLPNSDLSEQCSVNMLHNSIYKEKLMSDFKLVFMVILVILSTFLVTEH